MPTGMGLKCMHTTSGKSCQEHLLQNANFSSIHSHSFSFGFSNIGPSAILNINDFQITEIFPISLSMFHQKRTQHSKTALLSSNSTQLRPLNEKFHTSPFFWKISGAEPTRALM
jgi:hypothetical protein